MLSYLQAIIKPASIVMMCFYFNAVFCQSKTITILFEPTFGNKVFVLNDTTNNVTKESSVRFETLKFYISELTFLKGSKTTYTEKESFHLIDIANPKSLNIACSVPTNTKYDRVQFNLGIDSLTNVSGAMGGDLDPVKGMYWAWQSGYINFKLEGASPLCPGPKKEFQFHLGGYQSPFNALQQLSLPVTQEEKVTILVDMEQFIKAVDLTKQHHIMSPGFEAVKLSEKAAKCFTVKR